MNTLNPKEIEKFQAMANEWWDPQGKFKPLHQLNPTRLDYIKQQIATHYDRDLTHKQPFKGLRLLDIGCGGGLLSEPMSALGADVLGADAAPNNIPVAQLHAKQAGLTIDYRNTLAEHLLEEGEQFDVILNMEVIEHVADPNAFIDACGGLLKPNGLMLCSTINRNIKSYIVAIFGAERVMRWLPVGTHQWGQFIKPTELKEMVQQATLTCIQQHGFVFNPLRWRWSISTKDLSVNYVMSIVKPMDSIDKKDYSLRSE
ncbi:bifunctional 3-demethylubiquinol 3-O-methyltransferase/2-polyprenyl-6-hydroxyphenol methylase [Psychromonas sp. B3M02]|uniref:bifunctional 2-polyprenyl-6-hydroxyphenol methylase/3-demethylubiquinol 3-O-methyltransferase UbiG n=1 Tax=Psychromonas sp. B3M02 TaxID=2267226 RepID=UPI000DE8D453|nr:bifunctional 2-polyprenyl-6-hydroxyphenol methylase/3-demethylubiquinol 3-O-methyltransferase UbiG [Psychromonas sp. B3M02]RBW41620.1 bifunctional 3-demethylubiquinol 3-O-methyltransferase/2-polyprenyl-6-hydroxyphenol methylase [Psychromonas sp. B3M02]